MRHPWQVISPPQAWWKRRSTKCTVLRRVLRYCCCRSSSGGGDFGGWCRVVPIRSRTRLVSILTAEDGDDADSVGAIVIVVWCYRYTGVCLFYSGRTLRMYTVPTRIFTIGSCVVPPPRVLDPEELGLFVVHTVVRIPTCDQHRRR